jgi:hypothetical protein
MGVLWWWDAQHKISPPLGPFEGGGVTLERLTLEALPIAPRGRPPLGGAPGDWRFRSASASVVFGAKGQGVERAMRFGALLDAAARDITADRIDELRPILSMAGRRIALDTRQVAADPSGPTPALLVTQRGEGIELETRVWLDANRSWVHLETVLENRGREALKNVRLGDRVRWPGGAPFAPGLGFVSDQRTGRARWLGRAVPGLGYALVFADGDADLDFETDVVGPVEQRALSAPIQVEPGQSVRYRRVLVMSPAGLAGAAEDALRVLAMPFGQVSGSIEPPEPASRIEVRRADGSPELETAPDPSGRFTLAVPPGRYQVVLHAPGGRHEKDVEVRRGASTELTLLPPRAGALRVSVSDGRGAPMPARVTLKGRHPTPTPNLGTEQRAGGIANIAYAHDGQLNVELPPGSYTVRVTRGPEYALFEKDVEITAERGQALQVSLERIVDTRGWIAADLHLHAAPSSDSSVSLEDRVTALAGEGVEVAVATDHNHVTDYGPAIERRGLADDVRGITGVEITTGGWGHFNCYPYPKDERPPQFAGVVPWAIFADARALAPRSVIQVNHPRLNGIGYFKRLRRTEGKPPSAEEGFSFDFDTLEVVNGFELEAPAEIEGNLQDWFSLLDFGYVYTAVGNSDSHSLTVQWPGSPRTYVQVGDDRPDGVSADELTSSLLKGRAVISNGIFATVRVSALGAGGPGDLVQADQGRVLVEVTARAAPWVDVSRAELWVNGRLAVKAPLSRTPGARGVYGLRQTLELDEDSWVVVIVRGDRPLRETFPEARGTPLAIVNPVFVDLDGDGTFRAPHAVPPPASGTGVGGPGPERGPLPWQPATPPRENGGSAGSGS